MTSSSPQGTDSDSDAKAKKWQHSDRVPDMDLFVVTGTAHENRGSAKLAGQSESLHGKAAFDEARKRVGDNDPSLLASLSMLLLENDVAGREPWQSASSGSARPPEQQAIARPPSVNGDVLEYWRAHVKLADMVRCRVTLSTGAVSCELGGAILRAQAKAENPHAVIDKDLASDDIYGRMRGIKGLAELNDAAAHKKLQDLALNQGHYKVRAAAVDALAGTGGEGTVAAVSRVLLYDGHQKVRLAAAAALGKLADPAARESLEKAAEGDGNAQVRSQAKRSLIELP